MFETIRNAWKVQDLRKKLIYTFIMLIIFRLGSCIPVPLLDPKQLSSMFEGTNNSLFGFIDLVSGGAFQNLTIFAMSSTPYIKASIIMQLLCVAIPALERLQKEGEEGRKKIAQIQRYATVVLALIQAVGLYFLLKSYNAVTMTGFWPAVVIVITFSAGTAFLMWLGEQITEKGVGNGISLIIFAGIVSGLPAGAVSLWQYMQNGTMGIIGTIALVIVALVIVAFVVMMNEAERRIPVQYAKRVVGRKMYGGQNTNLPLKVNMSGVMPIIFANSIVAIPATITTFIGKKDNWLVKFVENWFNYNTWPYLVVFLALLIAFAFFYVAISFNPVEVANNIKNNGGAIPGIRSGRPTVDFIKKVLGRVTLVGALLVAIIACTPMLASLVTTIFAKTFEGSLFSMAAINMSFIAFGGSSLMIVVGVALETARELEAQMSLRNYKGFLD